MGAQRIATGIAVAALAGLFFSVGLPPLLPPAPVTEIVVPIGDGSGLTEPRQTPLPRRFHHQDDDPGESDGGRPDGDSPDGNPDRPDDSPDDRPDDYGEDDGD